MPIYNPPKEYILDEEDDALLDQAITLIIETGKASASLIQRHLKIGYARASRLLNQLEQKGIVGPAEGAKPRKILFTHGKPENTPVNPAKKAEPVKEEEPVTPIVWHKTKYTQDKTDHFEIDLGVDDNNNPVKFNFEKYSNLFIIGSQFTSAVDLLNSILANSMASYPPEELRLIVMDGVGTDVIVPNQRSHLLTPLILDSEKPTSALKRTVGEIENRFNFINKYQVNNIKELNNRSGFTVFPHILIVLNGFDQIRFSSQCELEDNLCRIMASGKKCNIYVILIMDFPDPTLPSLIMANSPAKLVFRPTDKKIARQTGIPESIDLTSPDEAILETMYEGKKRITINKVNPKEIYEEIFK